MNRPGHCSRLLWLVAVALTARAGSAAAEPAGKEEILVLPKVSVVANVPLVKVAEYHMREKRVGAAAVLSGWYIYIIGGQRAWGDFARTIERFDVQTGESKIFSALATGRLWPQAVAVGSKIYIFGGESPVATGKPKDDAPKQGVEQSAAARLAAAAEDTHGERHFELHPEPTIEVLDMATGTVTVVGKMPDPRANFSCVSLDGSIYVIGGKHHPAKSRKEPDNPHINGEQTVTNRVDVFNPATGQWAPGPNLPVTVSDAVCVAAGPGIIAAGGYTGSGSLDSVFAFDARTAGWSRLPALARARSAAAGACLGKYLFMFGDYNSPDEILAYKLKDQSSAVFTLRYEAARHAAVVANAKRIFIIGGKPEKEAEPLDLIQVFELTAEAGAGPGK